MPGIELFIVNLFCFAVSCGLFLGIGRLINRKKSFTYTEAFYALFFGILSISTLTALIHTKGVTILAVYLLMGVMLYYQGRHDAKTVDKPNIYSSSGLFMGLSVIAGILFVYIWSFLSLGQFDSFPYYIPDGTSLSPNDYIINTVRSFYLGLTGEENYYHVLNDLDPTYHGTKPYHYLEFWTTVAVDSCVPGLVAERFRLVVNNLFYLTSLIGILALMERYDKLRWYHICLAMSLMFCAGLYLPFYKGIFNDFSLPIFSHRLKMPAYYLFILACLIEHIRGNYVGAIWALLGLCVATIVAVPAIFGGVGVYILYHFFRKEKIAPTLLLQVLVTGVAIVLFYSMTGSQELNIRANAGTSELLSNLGSLFATDVPAKLLIIIKTIIEEIIIYIPVIVIGVALIRSSKPSWQEYRDLSVLVGGILLSGALAYGLFSPQKDAAQLFYNVANPVLNVSLIWFMIRLVAKWGNPLDDGRTLNRVTYLGCGTLIAAIISLQFYTAVKRNIVPARTAQHYSDQYLNEIRSFITSDDQITLGAAIKGGEDYASAYSWQTAAYTLGYYLAYMEDGSMALSISDYDIPMHEDHLGDRESALFYRFVQQQKADETFVSMAYSQLKFIEQYELDFIILSQQGHLPDELLAVAETILEDPISGERFLLINRALILRENSN